MSPFYIFSKLFTYLVLPPGIFIILMLLASFWARKFRILLLTCSIIFYSLCTTYIADILLAPLEKPYNISLHVSSDTDAVVVLGGGSLQGASNLPLSDEATKRALWGMLIARKHALPLLFSGGGSNDIYPESAAFKETAEALKTHLFIDIPHAFSLSEKTFSIHTENKSLDTYENAKLSQHLFEKAGISHPRIYLVTSAYHMKRSALLFEHFGFRVIPAATAFKISTKQKDAWDYFPSMWALEKSYTALHEYAGLLSLKLRGIH